MMEITVHIEGAKERKKRSDALTLIMQSATLIGRLPPVCPTVRGIFSVRMDLMCSEGGLGVGREGWGSGGMGGGIAQYDRLI